MNDRPTPKPMLIAFEVTGRCRFECRHCRANASAYGDGELTTDQCRKVLSSIADYNPCTLILTGGEPMERPDLLDLVRHGRDAGLTMVMASCGYRIDEQTIVQLRDAGIKALSFSLDGASSDTHDLFRQAKGSFDAVIRATDLARQAGVRFQINTTISRVNVHEVIAIAGLAERLGASCFNPFILVPTGRGKDLSDQLLDPVQYEILLNELLRIKLNSKIEVRVTCGPQFGRVVSESKAEKRVGVVHGCMGGCQFGFVSRRGDVQTCGFLDIPAGNLVQNGFDFRAIWERSDLFNRLRNRQNITGPCRLCPYLETCGGCRARAFAACGDCLASDPICGGRAQSEARP